jgi:hypothetical protein
MAKPVFNPTQFELRNELPVVVSDEQQTQIELATGRVNQQLNWVAQALGWSGPNYWTSLPTTVGEKRALLGGTYGVYNAYTLLPLVEIRQWEQRLITEYRPNVSVGQKVIIGDIQAYILDLDNLGGKLSLGIGTLTEEIISLLQQGAAVKVDIPQNRPFPFYRPEPLASGDADFRCSIGSLLRKSDFYEFYELILSPYSQSASLLPYVNLQLYAGSYYYFDRAVYLSVDPLTYVPWVDSQWVESKGLWQLYIHPEFEGNRCFLVWPYATLKKKALATTSAEVIQWVDPSDWGNGGAGFNPVLDTYKIERSYDISALNYGLGTATHLGDFPPQNESLLWFDSGPNILYARQGGRWAAVGEMTQTLSLSGQDSPPPNPNAYSPGLIWQSPDGRTFIWDAVTVTNEFYYFFPTSFVDGFVFIDPSFQSVEGMYIFDPENPLHYYTPDYATPEGFVIYNTVEDDEGFWDLYSDTELKNWSEIQFYDSSVEDTIFTPAYSANLYVVVNGFEIDREFSTENYSISWGVEGNFLYISYEALTNEGEISVPEIGVRSRYTPNTDTIFIGNDFKERPQEVTSLPYSETGILNNFLGVWGNKGGARSLDLVFDSLDIHGFDEQQALYVQPVNNLIDYDWMLHQVTGKQVFVGDQPPPGAVVGDYYWNNESGTLSVAYLDEDRNVIWVEINSPISPCQIGNPSCDYFPLKPVLTTGSCTLDDGDMWKDPETPGVALYYEGPNFSPYWVEVNWDPSIFTQRGWLFSESPNPAPDFNSLLIYLTDDFIALEPGVSYNTENYTFLYTIDEGLCSYRFQYEALTGEGVQNFPTVWVSPATRDYPPVSITDRVFSEVKFYLAPAVQNAGVTLRPWKTVSLEVTDEALLTDNTFHNPLVADVNFGPGDENWDRSFIRLPSEYGRNSKRWNQAELTVEDFTYAGTAGDLQSMKCPTNAVVPQIYDELVFTNTQPSADRVIYTEPFLYSSIRGYENPVNYLRQTSESSGGFTAADFDFGSDAKYDEWTEADSEEYEPLHYRQVQANGDWQGVYLKYTGNVGFSGFAEKDLGVKSLTTISPPVWDASIYKYPPLCPEASISYSENPNNCKVGYAYFAADLAAAEDGFFDQQQDVAWREPLVENQTLYMVNN